MKLQQFTYTINKKNKTLKVKICNTHLKKFKGLMFQKNSPPLLFIFNKTKKLSIHSFFCKPFTAIWLNEKKQATKITEVKNWRLNISGRGKYLLEIPRGLIRSSPISN